MTTSSPPTTATEDQPSNANDGCVGPSSQTAGKASACDGCPNQSACASGASNSEAAIQKKQEEDTSIRNSLSDVTHVVLVLSGKGGVGKSTVSCQVAHTLASRGYNVGLLDTDICGPSAPRMLGVVGREVHKSGSGWTPVYVNENLAVMSIAFLLPDADAAVVWRGPRKNGMIKQFLTETDWCNDGEEIDYLIVDTPPGTSDEHISTVQLLQAVGGVSGAIVVTTPEEVSMADVRKELNFCKKTNVKVLGVVENMASFKTKLTDLTFTKKTINSNDEPQENNNTEQEEIDCTTEVHKILKEKCPEILEMMVGAEIFPRSGGGPEAMAKKFGAPFLGSLPLDANLLKACEDGICFTENCEGSPAVKHLDDLVDSLVKMLPLEDEAQDL